MSQEKIYTVSEITREIKRVISENFGTLWIEGELSGYKRHSSGHHYFTLKDGNAQIPCAMWRMYTQRLTFTPADGMKVQAWGNLEVYEPGGRYQFIITQMRPSGIGELQRAFEALRDKLRSEGLFELERKRELPRYPNVVGLITSADGAALQDMRTVAARRWPAARLVLAPVKVQGSGAAEEIAAAIDAFNREGKADVLVVGRGGGSLEDLWAFNEEIVARAIFRSRIPVVSAVGHEVDFTIADLAADVRAPTPSAAMELILPDREEAAAEILGISRRLNARKGDLIRGLRHRLRVLSQHWALRQPVNLVHFAGQRLDELRSRFLTAYAGSVNEKRAALNRLRELTVLFRPQAILDRGYSIVRDADGRVIRDARMLANGQPAFLTFARGSAEAEIRRISDNGAADESS
ncbi:exodeoxyribonuclease VII large subunit [candidate division KSB1 bacterium]|nr:MAG: exodeoxyribonuclease VII large subunit [candidate division KSB1 bacterium]RPH94459.1 MAG: exodeoxyribonuclease VII large subunit [candidate division KSB1 bacterium]